MHPVLSIALQLGGAFVFWIVASAIFKRVTRPKYHAQSRITWKVSWNHHAYLVSHEIVASFPPLHTCVAFQGVLINWALWPEAILKRKPAFRKMTLASLKKEAVKAAKGLSDFG